MHYKEGVASHASLEFQESELRMENPSNPTNELNPLPSGDVIMGN